MAKRNKKFSHRRDNDEGGDWRQKFIAKEMPVISAMTPGQKKYIIEIQNNTVTFCIGPAGSGKTAVAVGIALQHIMAPKPTYEKLIIIRPVKEACDESIGYLKGSIDEKMQPWAAPIVDNMAVFVDQNAIKNLFYQKKVEILPVAYARGRSLNNSFVIFDEAQNSSPAAMLMVLTRLGKDSKMVITGDMKQSDQRGMSGLEDAVQRLNDIGGISVVRMESTDIVRNPLIGEILKRYGQE